MNITVVLIGVLALYFGANWLVDGSSRLARSYGMSQVLVGLTVVTLVTAGPELLIGIYASLRDAGGLVVGVVTGSNIANIGLVLGMSALVVGSMRVSTSIVRRGIPLMIIAGGVVYALLFFNLLNAVVSLLLIVAFIAFNIFMMITIRRDAFVKRLTTEEISRVVIMDPEDRLLADELGLLKEPAERINRPAEFLRTLAGVVVLLVGADSIVKGSLEMAAQLGANQVIIGATFVALVSALPEVIAISVAVRREQPDVIFGNIIGAAMTNLLLVMGIAGLIRPLAFDPHALRYEFPFMLFFMLLMLLVVFDRRLTRWEGLLYVVGYCAFIGGLFVF